MAKPALRADIQEALDRNPTKFAIKKEARGLSELLHEGETVSHVVGGNYGKDRGIVALTSSRILFIYIGFVSHQTEDFALEKVTSVDYKAGAIFGDITVFVSNQSATIEKVDRDLGLDFTTQARKMIGKPSAATATPGVPDQLLKLKQLHEAGVLTDAEYETKRAALVAQL